MLDWNRLRRLSESRFSIGKVACHPLHFISHTRRAASRRGLSHLKFPSFLEFSANMRSFGMLYFVNLIVCIDYLSPSCSRTIIIDGGGRDLKLTSPTMPTLAPQDFANPATIIFSQIPSHTCSHVLSSYWTVIFKGITGTHS
jgi:hypothetical protein